MSGIEAAGRKLTVELYSPEAKRLFLRHFNAFQRHMHFISVVARHALRKVDIDSVEEQIKVAMEEQVAFANAALSRAEASCREHGITSLAVYAVPPLTIDVTLISPFGRSLHELILKIDQLMPMLETLALDQIATNTTVFAAKSSAKKWVRRVAGLARACAGQLGNGVARASTDQSSSRDSSLSGATNCEQSDAAAANPATSNCLP
ncbi:AcaB family transcriptional regulator [Zemynaea arenosa]|uniref:AcaB family transcriptional regulator n=1 Tax=Zemynaea arenosa TaxID=2561931 RepID=UPI00142F41A1|nr:AcaB family transcriptional regulator [Massilia arenosa]